MPSDNIYRTSNGEGLRKSVIDRLIKRAKAVKLRQQHDQYGFNFCEDCGKSQGEPLDCSHNISVNEAQNTGRAELAFDVDNIKIRCRTCHQNKDGLNITNGGKKQLPVIQKLYDLQIEFLKITNQDPDMILMHPLKAESYVKESVIEGSHMTINQEGEIHFNKIKIFRSKDIEPETIIMTNIGHLSK